MDIRDFFALKNLDDIENKYAVIFFCGILFAGMLMILTIVQATTDTQQNSSGFSKGLGTVAFAILSIATVSTTLLPKLVADQSNNRFAPPAYFVFIFIFNVLIISLILVSMVVEMSLTLHEIYEGIGGIEATRTIIIMSIFIELFVDGASYIILLRPYKKIRDHWVMFSIVIVEVVLAILLLFGNSNYFFDPTLFLGFVLTAGHILTHWFN